MVHDLTNRKSHSNLSRWLSEFHHNKDISKFYYINIILYLTINMKMESNAQTHFKQTLVYKLLLCNHLEQEVIKI